MSAMVWMVFPKPISSARMPFKLLLYRDTNHSRPLICRRDRCNNSMPLNKSDKFTKDFEVYLQFVWSVPGTV